ncbi:MAG: SpoIID/LytB domain-containing protein [Synechococcales cyanobacterium M58_A2018_015]|nr:SpoIID/LytB domain-containing protein [Synechococcales cyanobacterium M58_A2018_015]
MAKIQVIQFCKRYAWPLLLSLGLLQVGVIVLMARLRQANSPLASVSAAPASPSAAVSPQPSPFSDSFSDSSPTPTAPTVTAKSASKSQPPAASQSTAESSPTLTAEQQALNEQYKQSFTSERASVDALVEMRVAIAEGVPHLSLGSSTDAPLFDEGYQPLQTLTAETRYTVQASGNGITINGTALPAVLLLEPTHHGLIYLGDRAYRGRLLLVNDSGKLWAVNLVNLRSYLHSVVASEVSPSWHPEALKAQAIAARSYALSYFFKPMSSLFHLGATEYYQVYSGIAREAPETSQAVDETAGAFVSYRGGVVESLYAASDDIVAEAFRGHGMSQLGALNLAEQGYTHEQILANYYPRTGIGRIIQDFE